MALQPSSMIGRTILLLQECEGKTLRSPAGDITAAIGKELGMNDMRSLSQALRKGEERGYLKREVVGKRTYSIAITDKAAKWAKDVHSTGLLPRPKPRPAEPTVGVDGRPGRLAARLEKTLPAVIEESVNNAVASVIDAFVCNLGYTKAGTVDNRVQELEELVLQLQAEIADLNTELTAERRLGHEARERFNRAYAVSDRSTLEYGTLQPHDLPKDWQKLAAEAIADGWVLRRTNGGHICWKAPNGGMVFSPSTPSDWRGIRNHRSDMDRVSASDN